MKIRGLLTALGPVLASRGIIPDGDGRNGGEVVGPDAIRPFVIAQLAGTPNSGRTVLAIVATIIIVVYVVKNRDHARGPGLGAIIAGLVAG